MKPPLLIYKPSYYNLSKPFNILTLILLQSIIAVNLLGQVDSSKVVLGAKAYNGTYIMQNEIATIMPQATVTTSIGTIADNINYLKKSKNQAIIVKAHAFNPSSKDIEALIDYVYRGNHVLLTFDTCNKTANTFLDATVSTNSTNDNTLALIAKSPVSNTKYTTSKIITRCNYFNRYDDEQATAIGQNENGTINFLQYKIGSGTLLVHLYPDVLSNYFMLTASNYQYTQQVLSYLPASITSLTIITASSKRTYEGNRNPPSIMGFINNNPNLSNAFYLLITLLVIILLLGGKKRQRTIPVIPALQNNTVEFTKTIAQLYFAQHNNTELAQQIIKYWVAQVRNKYNINTVHTSPAFWQQLLQKSKASNSKIQQLQLHVTQATNDPKLSNQALLQLQASINTFTNIT